MDKETFVLIVSGVLALAAIEGKGKPITEWSEEDREKATKVYRQAAGEACYFYNIIQSEIIADGGEV